MTSEQFHAPGLLTRGLMVLWRLAAWGLAVVVLLAVVAGCVSQDPMPDRLTNPFPDEQIWAVAPLANASGTSLADGTVLADRLAYAIDADVAGISTIPVNRVLAAMEANDLEELTTLEQANVLARTLGVDGLILGEISAYDPYDPPKYGASLLLVLQDRPLGRMASFDPHELMRMHTDVAAPGAFRDDRPTAIKLHLDAAAADVRAAVQQYAQGRVDPDTALGWERYIKSMELFTQFASQRLVQELLDQERLRQARYQAGV
jgi:hypothetical protein